MDAVNGLDRVLATVGNGAGLITGKCGFGETEISEVVEHMMFISISACISCQKIQDQT